MAESIKTIFLSSTFKDLVKHRKAVIEAIDALGDYKCVRMENFGARDSDADDFCRAIAAECDVFVGIVGHLHGTCPKASKQSYTEREYDAAVGADRPRLIFMAREDFPLPAKLREPDEKCEKQRAFRERVSRERMRDTFTSPDDLARRVVLAMRNWELEFRKTEARTHISQLERLFWPTASDIPATQGFRDRRHTALLEILQSVVDRELGEHVRVSILQSLADAGCDVEIVIPAQNLKVGVQLKSHNDIKQGDFATKTLSQIQDSRQHQLHQLYLVLAGDLTDESQREKVRNLHSRISRMHDNYVIVVPPERAWTLLCDTVPRIRAEVKTSPISLRPQPYFVHPYPMQSHFAGRVAERKILTEWLTEGNEAVFALIAIGGMGKSALTWAWLQRDVLGFPLPGSCDDPPGIVNQCRVREEARPEGVLWWSFYERGSTFEAFVAKSLSYASGGTVNPAEIRSTSERMEALMALLQQRRILLVLDGFERILRAYASLSAAYQGDVDPKDERGDLCVCTDPHAGQFLQWLASGAITSRVVVTSRLFPRELEGRAGCRRQYLGPMDPEDAVAFFRAQGVEKGTRAEIQAACEPYGYHPLALRLLAGVIVADKRNPGEVRVAERYPVLPELRGKEQHHILQVAYDTLDKPKRGLLSRIAAFRSPMTYDALCILNRYKSEEKFNAALDELTECGLLFFDREQERYDLHPVVRRYAYQRLENKAAIHARLADYFRPLADAVNTQQVKLLGDLGPVIELYWHTVRAGRYDEACKLLQERLFEPLYFALGSYPTCIELLGPLFPDGEDCLPRLEHWSDQVWTLWALANSYSPSGQPARALPLFNMHNKLCRQKRDMGSLSEGLANVADMAQGYLGQLKLAQANLREAIKLAPDQWGKAMGHHALGRVLAYRGALDEAAAELEDARLPRGHERRLQLRCVVLAYESLRWLFMGDAESAVSAARSARRLADEVARTRHPYERDFVRACWMLGWSLVELACQKAGRRDKLLSEAECHLTEALTRCRRINMIDREPYILLAWARWHCIKGDDGQARAHAEEALSIADRCEYRLAQADCHNFLARLELDAGDGKSAVKHARTAYERAWCDGPPHCYKPALDEAERLLKELGESPPSPRSA